MGAGPLVADVSIAFLIAACLLYRYGNWFRHHIIVTLAVLMSWYFSFLIIFVLPLDVSATVYRQCKQKYNLTKPLVEDIHSNISSTPSPTNVCWEPWSSVPDHTFPNLWRIVYWTSQFLTWIIMPLMQSYTQAGDFTIRGKLKSALVDNAIYYGSYLFIAGILLIYLAVKPHMELDWQKLKAITSSASNTWGLFLLVLLLGYALVEVPRNLWNNSKRGYTLEYSYFKAAKLSVEKCEAEETVDDLLESLQNVVNAVKPGHPLHRNLECILYKIPVEMRDRMSRRGTQDDGNPANIPSEKTLVRLHKQLIKALQTHHRTEAQWGILVRKVFLLEDIAKNQVSHDRRFKPSFPTTRNALMNILWTPTIEWYYRCIIHYWLLKVLAVITGILSIMVVWSEVTFFNEKPVLSLFAVFLNMTIKNYDYFTMELVSTCFIAYLCYCAYSTVLQLKFLNKYYIAPNHQTDEFSLIFSGMMLCRLTPPMCLNFLGLIHMDNHIIKTPVMETSYTQIMGHMDVISIISDGFNIYFPMLMLLFCLATYFSLGSRFLSFLGFQQFMGDDELTTDLVEEGRELIKRERRRRQRIEESENRRRDFNERFGGTNLSGWNRSRDQGDQTRGRAMRRNESGDSARTILLTDSDQLDYYVQPSGENATRTDPFFDGDQRDRVGRLPKGFFDDV
ncbi:UNVERIFIED_CONTAM: hypothetical protein PYX00_004584 [Menopon gallinae]|uniref:LMBR1 domain-containing protein 2 n=1 Tax=Menopon gallinae TaxID=328185 RepID=A0AAW2I5W6_9NEOP